MALTTKPHINWEIGVIREWGPACHLNCLRRAPFPLTPTAEVLEPLSWWGFLRSTMTCARCLARLKRLLHCLIDLMTATSISYFGPCRPRGRPYSLSEPEHTQVSHWLLELYVILLLQLVLEEKDKSLCRCIDYRGVNDITVNNHHSLLLIASAFELFQGVRVFIKLELLNAAN